jgi:PsbN protein
METASILIIFMASLLVGITGYSVYTSFGSASKNLRDPFEEHEGKPSDAPSSGSEQKSEHSRSQTDSCYCELVRSKKRSSTV